MEDSQAEIDSCISLACVVEQSSDFSKPFRSAEPATLVTARLFSQTTRRQPDRLGTSAAQQTSKKPRSHCQFCGLNQHPRSKCPARRDACLECSKEGHWASVCRSTVAALHQSSDDELETAAALCSTDQPPAILKVSIIPPDARNKFIGPCETQCDCVGKWRLPGTTQAKILVNQENYQVAFTVAKNLVSTSTDSKAIVFQD